MQPPRPTRPPVLPTGLVLLSQAVDYLVDRKIPGLRERVALDSIELALLQATLPSKAPLPPSHLPSPGQNRLLGPVLQAVQPMLALQADRTLLLHEVASAQKELAQNLCDGVYPSWVLWEGHLLDNPRLYWTKSESDSAFVTDEVKLLTAHGEIRGWGVLRLADLNPQAVQEAPSALAEKQPAEEEAPEENREAASAPPPEDAHADAAHEMGRALGKPTQSATEVEPVEDSVPQAVIDFVAEYKRPSHKDTSDFNAWERQRVEAAKNAPNLKGIHIGRELLRKADKARRLALLAPRWRPT